MAEWRLRRQIDKARSRWRHYLVVLSATVVWIVGLTAALLLAVLQRSGRLQLAQGAEFVIAAAGVGLLVLLVRAWRISSDRREVARRIEKAFPELDSSLLAALDVTPDAETGHVGYLSDRVVGNALSHAYQHGWQKFIPARRLLLSHAFHLATLVLFVLAIWQLRSESALTAAQTSEDVKQHSGSDSKFELVVEPGNTEIERGTSLLVLARFKGSLPPEATLVYEPIERPEVDGAATAEDGDVAAVADAGGRVPMSKALDDPLFGGSVNAVREPLAYYVEYAGQQSEKFRVTVFEYPRLVRADALLRFPKYTSLEEKLVQDVRKVSAVVGTEVTVTLELNKPVKLAELKEQEGTPLALQPLPNRPNHYSTTFTLDRTRRFEVALVDDRDRKNKETVELVFTAIANQPPDLKLAAPAKDTQVSPLEELELKAKAFDDFGLRRVGLTYVMAGKDEQEMTLAKDVAPKERLELAHVVAFEKLAAEPDQLMSYYFWAEDTGPDGELRRTSSDMFFAEVRPFEEIFRQGAQPAGGQQQSQSGSQNANVAEKLADLQKEIINATWKLIRRETGAKPSDAFESDLSLLVESQTTALEQTEQLAERIRDSQAMKHIDDARRSMNETITHLIAAKDSSSAIALSPALNAEQQAYQSLLKLRAREHEVTRAQRQPGAAGSSSSSRSQQQLDQLQLKDQENRYEAERTAQPPEDPAEREMRQVLNRLKELARRQGDLNERLQELQTALQEAKTEEQKEELRRQLKRLQEEQEQLLRDTEELQSRMDQPQNMERMSESRQQLDDARERVRQASEALREGMVPQAASAGARAEEDFQQLRDDFRKQTSDQFQQDVRELSEQARALDEREQQLAEQLKNLQQPAKQTKSLRDGGEREKLLEGLGEQKQRSDELLERMRQTIQEAEGPQPLLAEQLYDAARNAQQKNLAQNLETTREAIRRGLMEPALQYEDAARQTISELRAGVDRAAQNVLEDETEALRRAEGHLENLSQELGEELARNGQAAPERRTDPSEQTRSGSATDSQSPQNAGQDEPTEGNAGNEPSEQSSRGQSQRKSESQGKGSGQKGSERESQTGRGDGEQKDHTGENESGDDTESKQSDQKSDSENQKGKGQPKGQGSGKGKGEQKGKTGTDGQQSDGQQSDGHQPGQSGQSGEPSQSESPSSEGEGQPGGSGGRSSSSDASDSQRSSESSDDREGQPGQQQRGQRGTPGGNQLPAGFDELAGPTGGGGNQRMLAPFTGNDFREWSDRLRDVEEMLGDPELSAEAARIRERARALRAESKRHSAPPNWDLVKMEVAEPLAELLDRVHIELLKRTRSDLLVPLDRDPVPPKYTEQVRKYYERLGAGK